MDNTVPETALDNPPVTVTLGGHTFEFAEPRGLRAARRISTSAIKLLRGHEALVLDSASGAIGIDFGKAVSGLELLDAIQDWLYDVLPVPDKMRQEIDDKATPDEINAAFASVMEVVNRPFGGGIAGSGRETTVH